MANRSNRTGRLLAYAIILGFVMLSGAAVLVHAGSVLNYAFPVLALMVAAVLVVTQPAIYAAFTLWIWFFTPLVRRLVDFQTGFHKISPVMMAPLLVTGLTLVPIMRRPRILLRREVFPISVVLLIITYAFLLGIFTSGPLASGFEFANWLLPLTFGIFLMMQREKFPEVRDTLVFANVLGLLLVALYGIYQYFRIPAWDAYWLSASNFSSGGIGVAEQVRVFSTLNSPGPYAFVLMTCLVFVFVSKGLLRIVAGGAGFLAFGLSLVRSAWGGWVVAVGYVLLRSRAKTRIRILLAGGVVALIVFPLVTAGPVADELSKRFSTFNNIQQDASFKARQGQYSSGAIAAITEPVGVGFGQVGLATKLTTGKPVVLDAGLLQAPMEFGWFGTLAFIWAIGVMVLRVINATSRTKDQVAVAGAGIFLAMILENVLNSDFSGSSGISLWMGYAFAVGAVPAARRVVARNLAGRSGGFLLPAE